MHIHTLILTLYIHTVDASAGLPRTCIDVTSHPSLKYTAGELYTGHLKVSVCDESIY